MLKHKEKIDKWIEEENIERQKQLAIKLKKEEEDRLRIQKEYKELMKSFNEKFKKQIEK